MASLQQIKDKIPWRLLRIVVGVVALSLVARQVNWQDQVILPDGTRIPKAQADPRLLEDEQTRVEYGVKTLLENSQPAYMLAAVGVFAFVPVLMIFRWQSLLAVQGVNLSTWEVTKLTYLGLLLNFFLIGTTGGDLVKAYLVGPDKRAEAFVSVFFDRLVGLGVLVVFAMVLAICFWRDPQVATLVKPIAVLLILVVLAGLLLVSRRARRVVRLEKWLPLAPLGHILARLDRALLAYRLAYWPVVKAAVLTLALQVLASLAGYCLGLALGMEARVWHYLLYVPLAFLIGSIPVSVFWGLGLLEGAYMKFFTSGALATGTQAAMLAMAVRLVQMFWSLPGLLALGGGVKVGKIQDRALQSQLAEEDKVHNTGKVM